jgi:hypothetical protein
MRAVYAAWAVGLTLASAAAATPVRAQATTTNVKDEIALTRADVQARRQEIIGAMMELTPEESDKFWPVYREYRGEIEKVGDERVKFIEQFAKSSSTMSDEESKQLLDQWFKLRGKQLDIQKKYAGKFRKVLPGAKVARFYQVENALDTVVSANLQAAMPVAGDKGE